MDNNRYRLDISTPTMSKIIHAIYIHEQPVSNRMHLLWIQADN